jgi:hypothetical protein
MYKQAIRDGIVPDRRMVAALMNAHVEAQSWQGVIRAFDYLKSVPSRKLRVSIEVYNTLLKAYVLIGAPFHIVSELFGKLEQANVRPNAYTFALLIMSACDAGRMDIASDIFKEMDRLAQHWESHLHINEYVLTVIMGGYLRLGDKVQAKIIYDEMRHREIQPSATTFGAILRAYGNEKSEENLKIAEDFLKILVEAEERPWLKPTGGRSPALEQIYRPLMEVYAQDDRLEDVERHFQGMLDAGGEPTLGALAALLYTYSRAGKLNAVHQIWSQIFQLGLRHSRTKSLFEGAENESGDGENESETPTERQANLLCVPFSIYIEALSMAGMHAEIATVWRKMKYHGFAFDSHNWNHLSMALVRAGELVRAFQVIEKVLIPYQRRSRDFLMGRNKEPESPLMFNDVSEEDEPAFEGPGRYRERRAQAVKTATRETRDMDLSFDDEDSRNDFARPLHILHQISPSWNIWRPHHITLNLLARVLSTLESGRLVHPVKPGQADQFVQTGEMDRRERFRVVADVLEELYTNCPRAVQAVRDYIRRGGSSVDGPPPKRQ